MNNGLRPMTLCVLLYAVEGEKDGLRSYEDKVLPLILEHGGRLVVRLQSSGQGHADEVQVIQFDGQDSFDAFVADPRRLELADERGRVIAKTEQFEVETIELSVGPDHRNAL
jgi:uncharacterized protein (DUF1330 family)